MSYMRILIIMSALAGQVFPQEYSFSFSVTEEEPTGTIVGNVKTTGPLVQLYNQSFIETLKLTVDSSDAPGNFFSIESNSGNIITTQMINREEIENCIQNQICFISLDILVEPMQYFQILKVKVEILDINDNTPIFPEDTDYVSIPENSPVGTSFILQNAIDLDSPINGPANYSFLQPSRFFWLSTQPGSGELILTLMSVLDYEESKSHIMNIVVVDGGAPPHYSSMTVNVSVVDINDNPPVFTETPYEVTIQENTEAPFSVLRVSSIDPDSGPGGRINYHLSSRTESSFGYIFKINSTTGWITANISLDYEKVTEYNLVVLAMDSDPLFPLISQALVSVFIGDTNDNSPQIQATLLVDVNADGHIILTENNPSKQPLIYLVVLDEDSGTNGKISCSVDSPKFNVTEQDIGRFILQTADIIDREMNATFNINITCWDHGSPKLYASKAYQVDIMDVNDNAPYFRDLVPFELLDTWDSQQLIAQVKAHDPDAGENGTIHYTLDSGYNNLFEINSQDGKIYITVNIQDTELINMTLVNITVIVHDFGNPPNSNSTIVIFKIVKEDFDPPVFLHEHFTFKILENSPLHTEVGQIQVHPSQKPFSNFITYSTGSETGLPFFVNSSSGMITCTEQLDRESKEVYSFQARVKYEGQIVHSLAMVSVVVGDLNDNAPTVIFPIAGKNNVTIPNNIKKGSTIAKVNASDPDSGDNAQLVYGFQQTSDDILLINKSDGRITLAKDISDIEYKKSVYNITVEDMGVPKLQTTSTLIFIISSSLVVPTPPDGSNLNGDDDIQPWIYGIAIGAGILIIIFIVIAVVMRRQCTAEKKYKDMEKKLESLKNNPSGYDGSIGSTLEEMTSDKESDLFDSFREGTSLDNIMKNRTRQHPVGSDTDTDSACSTATSASDSGRGSGARLQRGGVLAAGSLRNTYIPEDGVYVPDLTYPLGHRNLDFDKRISHPNAPLSRSSSHELRPPHYREPPLFMQPREQRMYSSDTLLYHQQMNNTRQHDTSDPNLKSSSVNTALNEWRNTYDAPHGYPNDRPHSANSYMKTAGSGDLNRFQNQHPYRRKLDHRPRSRTYSDRTYSMTPYLLKNKELPSANGIHVDNYFRDRNLDGHIATKTGPDSAILAQQYPDKNHPDAKQFIHTPMQHEMSSFAVNQTLANNKGKEKVNPNQSNRSESNGEIPGVTVVELDTIKIQDGNKGDSENNQTQSKIIISEFQV